MERSVLTYFGACDRRFSDEQILAVLHDAERGTQPLAELCATHGISIPMYCVWKAKYRGLTPDALRARRRRADWKARTRLGGVVLVAAAVVVGAVVLVMIAGGSATDAHGDVAHAEDQGAPHADADTVGGVLPEHAHAGAEIVRATDRAAPSVDAGPSGDEAHDPPPATAKPERAWAGVEALRVEPAPAAGSESATSVQPVVPLSLATPPPSADEGYAVQVAAAPTLDHAQAMVATLTAAGHPVQVVPVTVNDVEYFRVRVGPFDTQRAAEEAAGTLKRNGYPGAWLVR